MTLSPFFLTQQYQQPWQVVKVREGYGTALIETTHTLHALIMNRDSRLGWHTALADKHCCFARSCLKPVQALVLLEALEAQHRLASTPTEAMALACASHSGTPEHQYWVRWLLEQVPATSPHHSPEADLVCGVHAPIDARTQQALLHHGEPLWVGHHNCSGKHAALRWACFLNRWPIEGYQYPEHPLQQRIQAWVALLSQQPVETLAWAMDGCGLPSLYASLGQLATIAQGLAQHPLGQVALQAMQQHPPLVAGGERLDTLLPIVSGGQCLSKIGADGLIVVWHHPSQQVLLLRCEDGNNLVRDKATVYLLEALGWISPGYQAQYPSLWDARCQSVYESHVACRLLFEPTL
ncbi:MAG: asparaginase [Vampirovibrionales bacterium]